MLGPTQDTPPYDEVDDDGEEVLRLLQKLDQAMMGSPEPTPVEELLRRIQGQGEEEEERLS